MTAIQLWIQKLKKVSNIMLLGALFLLIAFILIIVLDKYFCQPEILDIVFTCHEELLWPVIILNSLFFILFIVGLPLFIISKFILWRMSKSKRHGKK